MKVTIKHWHPIAQWYWNVGKESNEETDEMDDLCGICRVPYDGCCPACKVPGDDCPLSQSVLSSRPHHLSYAFPF